MKRIIMGMLLALVLTTLSLPTTSVEASCAGTSISGRWINPHRSNSVIRSVFLANGCSDYIANGRANRSNGSARVNFSHLDTGTITSRSNWATVNVYKTASIVLEYPDATVEQSYHLLPSGWLQATTTVNYHATNQRDFVRTEYLLRAYDQNSSQSVAQCGIGCIAGADVRSVSFVMWDIHGDTATHIDRDAMFCAVASSNSRCFIPTYWAQIDALVFLTNGHTMRMSWSRHNRYPQLPRPVWPDAPAQSTSNRTTPPPKAVHQTRSVTPAPRPQSPTPPPTAKSLRSPQMVTLDGYSPPANCQTPTIVVFEAIAPPADRNDITFSLRYKVTGADRVELFGNRLPAEGIYHITGHQNGASYWHLWAKVNGTNDNCYAQASIQVTP